MSAAGNFTGANAATRLRSTAPSSTPVDVLAASNTQPFPDIVDVMVRIFTDEGAGTLVVQDDDVAPDERD